VDADYVAFFQSAGFCRNSTEAGSRLIRNRPRVEEGRVGIDNQLLESAAILD
jgi:hypothetical protein